MLSFWVDRHLGGGAPWVFHLDNVILHAIVCALLTLLVLRRTQYPYVALAAGALFAAFAVSTEDIAGLTGRAELLAAAFGLGALLSTRRAAAGLCLLAALLCKESALVFAGCLMVFDRKIVVPVAATSVYLALRAGLFGFHVHLDNVLAHEGLGVRVLTGLALLVRAVRQSCSRSRSDDFALGRSSDAQTWTKVFTFDEMRGPLSCPAGTPGDDKCAPIWPTLAKQFGIDAEAIDAGPTVDVDAGGKSGKPGTCGCGVGSAAFVLILLPPWFGRRKRALKG